MTEYEIYDSVLHKLGYIQINGKDLKLIEKVIRVGNPVNGIPKPIQFPASLKSLDFNPPIGVCECYPVLPVTCKHVTYKYYDPDYDLQCTGIINISHCEGVIISFEYLLHLTSFASDKYIIHSRQDFDQEHIELLRDMKLKSLI